MPVPAVIASAAQNYEFNSGFLVKLVSDLAPEEWLKRPDGKCNHIAWITGHILWTRKALLGRLGAEWSQPWLSLFGRGTKCENDAAYPSPDAMVGAWRDASGLINETLANASEEFLAQTYTKGPPSTDGKESGVVTFLAIHETYHIGPISYVRSMLGHKGLMG